MEARLGGGDDIAVFEFDGRAQRLKRLQVQIHRAGADGAAAGERDLGFAVAGQQGGQHLKRGAHFAHHVVGGEGRSDGGGVEGISVTRTDALPRRVGDANAEAFEQVGHGAHIGQARDIGQDQGISRQQRRRHQLEGRILGAADGDFPRKPPSAAYSYPVHGPVMGEGRPVWQEAFGGRAATMPVWGRGGAWTGWTDPVGARHFAGIWGFSGRQRGRRPCAGPGWRAGPQPAFRGRFWP